MTTYFEKARRALAGARLLLAAKDCEGACSRAYYAMFNAACAALHATQGATSRIPTKTHRSVIAAFGKDLVLTGRVDAELGRSFNKVEAMRIMADYTGDPPTIEDATWSVEQAEIFVGALHETLPDL